MNVRKYLNLSSYFMKRIQQVSDSLHHQRLKALALLPWISVEVHRNHGSE